MTTPVALLELQVWAARALIAAGLPGGAVDQAARLVVLAQIAHDEAAAGFVADLPVIAARDHGVPELGEGGAIDGRGLHALAVAPGVLDLVCADKAATVWRVARSRGAWVLPGLALQGRDAAGRSLPFLRARPSWPGAQRPASPLPRPPARREAPCSRPRGSRARCLPTAMP